MLKNSSNEVLLLKKSNPLTVDSTNNTTPGVSNRAIKYLEVFMNRLKSNYSSTDYDISIIKRSVDVLSKMNKLTIFL